jgi:hypothetical protein
MEHAETRLRQGVAGVGFGLDVFVIQFGVEIHGFGQSR